MKKQFTEEQIIGVLKEAETGMKPAELCRKHRISEATYYKWKAKYGGMTVSEAQRLKDLEQENNKLKRLLAAPTLVIIGSRTRTLKGNSLRAGSKRPMYPRSHLQICQVRAPRP
jgi:putative transposase